MFCYFENHRVATREESDMKHSNRPVLTVMTAMLIFACGGKPPATGPRVVASTAWTAAFARAAGVGDCAVIAPYELQHPPEYELKPNDVKVIAGARVFVYAGYENMMKTLADKVTVNKITMVKIATDYDPAAMYASIRAVAAAAGTRAAAEKNIASLERIFTVCRERVNAAGGFERKAVVHAFQKRLAHLFGLSVAGVFGPAPLEAKQIVEASRTGAPLIVDNWHNPVSGPLRETLPDAAVAEFINFPGKDGTRTLEDVLRYNCDRLIEALRE